MKHKRLRYSHTIARPLFCQPTWNLQSSTTNVCCHYEQFRKKNEVSILINGWVIDNYGVSRPSFWTPSWNLLSDLCHTSKPHVRCHYAQFNEENEVSILINGWVTANYSFHSRHFVRHLGICNRICVNLQQLMSGVITHISVKKKEVSILINGWVTAKYSVSRTPYCPTYWNL